MNDFTSGLPLTFESFSALAGLEPAEIARLAPGAGSGERPLRGWVRWMTDTLGPREMRPPLDLPPEGPRGETGPRGVGIRALGRDEDGYLIAVLTDDSVHDLGRLDGLPAGGGEGGARRRSVAELTAAGLPDGARVTLREYHAGTGLGGGELVWRAGSGASPDGGGIFAASDQAAGRFFRTAHLLGTFTPEDFGAIGNGTHDDYPAFMNLGRAVTARGGGAVEMRKGATYYYGQYIDWQRTDGGPTDAWRDIPTFRRCDGLRVEMNGATIKTMAGGHRTQGSFMFTGPENIQWWDSPVDSVSALTFAYCRNFTLRGGKLDGSARTWTRWGIPPVSYRAGDGYPQGGAHLNEPYHQGLNLWGCEDFVISNMDIRDFMTDGVFVSHSEVWGPEGAPQRVTNETRTLCKRGTLVNVRSLHNRRQGMSVVGARGLTSINCDFAYTGHTGVMGADGKWVEDAYGWHEPGSGVDIEPSTHPTHPNVNWRVPEKTGDVLFLNCRSFDNMNGALICMYSNKIYGNVHWLGGVLDDSRSWFPDSGIMAAAGVTIQDAEIRLGNNGFLFMDPDATQIRDVLGTSVLNCTVYIKRSWGWMNPNRPIPLTLKGNRVFAPATPTGGPLAEFYDRANKKYGIGGFVGVRYEDNHHFIPYSWVSDKQYGDVAAFFEGVGQVSGNVWELTGTRPADWGVDATVQVFHRSDLSGGVYRYDTRPQGERYVTPAGSPNPDGDWLIDTPRGFKLLRAYTDASDQVGGGTSKGYIPFGLPGDAPQGDTTLSLGSVRGDTRVTGVSAEWGLNMPADASAVLRFVVAGTVRGTATFAAGQQGVASTTGFPFVVFGGSSLGIDLTYTGPVNNSLAGHLLTEDLA